MLNPHAAQCTAKSKRSGERCKNPAVNGWTVCRMHGARGGRPIIHGMHAKRLHRELLAEISHNPRCLNPEALRDFGRQVLEALHDKRYANAEPPYKPDTLMDDRYPMNV